MKRTLLIVVLIAASCGGPEEEAPADQPQTETEVLDPEEETAGEGVQLFFYAVGESETGERPPSFEIQYENFEEREDDTYIFREAHAVIHTEQGPDVAIDAGEAIMNYATKTAVMEEGVVLDRGAMNMVMDQLQWSDSERLLMSDEPVTIEHGETLLKGSTMRYYPDENRAVLTDTTGIIPLFDEDGEESQSP